jgi:hypothetical protein
MFPLCGKGNLKALLICIEYLYTTLWNIAFFLCIQGRKLNNFIYLKKTFFSHNLKHNYEFDAIVNVSSS